MKIRLIITILALFVFQMNICAGGIEPPIKRNEYVEIKLYFVKWNILTRTRLIANDVRKMRNVYIEINDSSMIQDIVNRIFMKGFLVRNTIQPEDARLVIELVKQDGNMDVFYANREHLLTIDSKKFQKTGNLFAELLDFLDTR